MARMRMVKPGFWTDARTGKLSPEAKCMALGLLNIADDYGVLAANFDEIQVQIFPYSSGSPTTPLPEMMAELEKVNYLQLFSFVTDDNPKQIFIYITNFTKHQIINKPSKPLLHGWIKGDTPRSYAGRMRLELASDSPAIPGLLQQHSHTSVAEREGKGKGNGKGKVEEGSETASSGFDSPGFAAALAAPSDVDALIHAFDARIGRLWGENHQRMARNALDTVWANEWLTTGRGLQFITGCVEALLDKLHARFPDRPPGWLSAGGLKVFRDDMPALLQPPKGSANAAAAAPSVQTEEHMRKSFDWYLGEYRKFKTTGDGRQWNPGLGKPPGMKAYDPECKAPIDLLVKHGYPVPADAEVPR